jgi:hypothetical protein
MLPIVQPAARSAQEPAPAADKLTTMQNITPVWLLIAPCGVLAMLLACRWWYGRQRRRLEHRYAKLQSDRDALQGQVRQARQQVAQLQTDLAAARAAAAPSANGKTATPRPTEPSRPPVTVRPEIASGLVFDPPQLASHGFADTQPFDPDAVAGFARTRQ